MKIKNRTMKNRRGFTLMELFSVLAVIGILLMVAMPKMGAYFDSYYLSEARYNHQTMVYCIKEWAINNENKEMLPGNFEVKNSQGKTVVDYLKFYNEEYYNKYFSKPLADTQQVEDMRVRYILKEGRFETHIIRGRVQNMVYSPLDKMTNPKIYVVE